MRGSMLFNWVFDVRTNFGLALRKSEEREYAFDLDFYADVIPQARISSLRISIRFDQHVTTGSGKGLDGAMFHDHSPQETYECALLATFTQGKGTTTLRQNRFQAMGMGG